MVLSMTGFARTTFKDKFGSGFLEIRSLNHRHLDISIRLPEIFRSFEKNARDLIKSKLQRGKIDCYLNIELSHPNSANLTINKELVNSLALAEKNLTKVFKSESQLNFIDILKWPNVINPPEFDIEDFSTGFSKLFNAALDELFAARQREGENLAFVIVEKLTLFQKQHAILKANCPVFIEEIHRRYRERIAKLVDKLDFSRVEQECALLIQKLDVSEELDRIQSHVEEMLRALGNQGSIGRRLDFLLQELARETNTLGAKSSHTKISAATIEMKVLLEQMREQVQNVE